MSERNAPCPCGSGKKFKRCHYLIDHEAGRQKKVEEPRPRPSKQVLATLLGLAAAATPGRKR